MKRRDFLSGAAAALLPAPLQGQPPSARLPRVGVLTLRRPAERSEYHTALIESMRERGWVDGRSMVLDYPDAQGREDRLPALAEDVVRRKADVILIVGPAALTAAHKATKSIPLVMVAASADPVADGVAASLARPGGNVTGLTYAEPDRFKKQLELLKAAAPRTSRVAVLWDFDLAEFRRSWDAPLREAARILDMMVHDPVRVRGADDLPAAFETIRRQQAHALIVAAGGSNLQARKQVCDLALRHGLPGIAAFRLFAQAGLLMSYGPDLVDINHRAGGFVDRILKGARPADLPIELPNKFDLAINMATARALDLAIPQPLLLRASEVFQ
jgi:putative ABC transport system substrate-binding protein